eukprot:1230986-Amphidinium_carterae.4
MGGLFLGMHQCGGHIATTSLSWTSSTKACSASAVKSQSKDRLTSVKRRYKEVSLQLRTEKEQLRASEASVWGAVISSERRDVRGNVEKLKALVFLTVEVLRKPFVSTHVVQKIVGFWVYHCLFQRTALCVLQETYRWLEEGKDDLHARRQLPSRVRQELQGYVLLFPLLRADLTSCIHPCYSRLMQHVTSEQLLRLRAR